MKLKVKIAIFLVALLVTFVGFNLVASPATLEIFNLERVRGEDVVVTVTAGLGPLPQTVVQFSG
jgi:hypothetical protein